MVVESAPEIVHHPLADRCCQILFGIGADCADYRDGDNGECREVQYGILVIAKRRMDGARHPLGHLL